MFGPPLHPADHGRSAARLEYGPFAGLPADLRAELASASALRHLEAGELVFRRGSAANDVLIVQRGLIAVEMSAGERPLTVALAGQGDLFGDVVLAGIPHRTTTTHALRDATVLSIDAQRVHELRTERTEVDATVMWILADAIHRLTDQLVETTSMPLATRLRRLLLRLRRDYADGVIELTQEQIGDLLGAQRTTVTELLSIEANAGRVQTRRGRIIVTDPVAMHKLTR